MICSTPDKHVTTRSRTRKRCAARCEMETGVIDLTPLGPPALAVCLHPAAGRRGIPDTLPGGGARSRSGPAPRRRRRRRAACRAFAAGQPPSQRTESSAGPMDTLPFFPGAQAPRPTHAIPWCGAGSVVFPAKCLDGGRRPARRGLSLRRRCCEISDRASTECGASSAVSPSQRLDLGELLEVLRKSRAWHPVCYADAPTCRLPARC